jgi:FAD/FMN-containing dehydrogenase/Fe-S oxidoreductase
MNNLALHDSNLADLHDSLSQQLSGECDFTSAAVALYSSDASNYRQVPKGVVFPRNTNDIKLTVSLCAKAGLPILMRGGGTSQNGQCVNEGIVIDCSRFMNRILEIDTDKRCAVIEPGVVCDALKHEAQKYGLTFGPDPATHSRCTLGGMIGNNSCGPHSMMAGKTVENVLELEVMTTEGEIFWIGPTTDDLYSDIVARGGKQADIYTKLKSLGDQYAEDIRQHFPNIKRRVSGFNLDQLLPENHFNVARALVGTEGTCVSILRAKVKLIENPQFVQLVVLGFEDIFKAGDLVPHVMPFEPIAMEGLDWGIIGGLNARNLRQQEIALLPNGRGWLLIELAAASEAALQSKTTDFTQAMENNALVKSVKPVSDAREVTALWSIREQGASATSLSLNPSDPDPVVGWEDTAVDPMRLGDYLRDLYALVDRYGYSTSMYGHFGDGCIHARMTFDTRTEAGVAKWRRFSEEIATLVVSYGGSLSGEHGDGQAKAEFLPIMFGDKLVDAFRQFKEIWDPGGVMNPGKVVNPFAMDENLRYGPDYNTPEVTSTLQFVDDVGGLGRATERCIGMGKCRAASGSMCPSFQATNEERFSTRGRAHLLHELIRGEIFEDGWNDNNIAHSLEHCLSCKACKSACPTKVDIAAFKAEFMSRHYQQKRRPIRHYVFGFVGSWLPKVAKIPALANLAQKTPVKQLAYRMLNLDANAKLPAVTSQSFSTWSKLHANYNDDHFYWFGDAKLPPVVVWADTVNSHYYPQALKATVHVLQKCQYRVGVAKQHFCCGRPLYEYGFLDKAKTQAVQIIQNLYPHLPDNTKVIVQEPACLSVFKDELLKLFPNDDTARDLAVRTMSLTQFLDAAQPPILNPLPKAVLHLHCHDKGLNTDASERHWMQQCVTDLDEPEEACCGMAGTFGQSKTTRHIAKTLVNRNIGPAIDKQGDEVVVISNGFSCRGHIAAEKHTRVLHPAEVLERCL